MTREEIARIKAVAYGSRTIVGLSPELIHHLGQMLLGVAATAGYHAVSADNTARALLEDSLPLITALSRRPTVDPVTLATSQSPLIFAARLVEYPHQMELDLAVRELAMGHYGEALERVRLVLMDLGRVPASRPVLSLVKGAQA